MREANADIELNAAGEADELGGDSPGRSRIFFSFALYKRMTVSLDGEDFDQSLKTAKGFREMFGSEDWTAIGIMGGLLAGDDKKLETFRNSIEFTA